MQMDSSSEGQVALLRDSVRRLTRITNPLGLAGGVLVLLLAFFGLVVKLAEEKLLTPSITERLLSQALWLSWSVGVVVCVGAWCFGKVLDARERRAAEADPARPRLRQTHCRAIGDIALQKLLDGSYARELGRAGPARIVQNAVWHDVLHLHEVWKRLAPACAEGPEFAEAPPSHTGDFWQGEYRPTGWLPGSPEDSWRETQDAVAGLRCLATEYGFRCMVPNARLLEHNLLDRQPFAKLVAGKNREMADFAALELGLDECAGQPEYQLLLRPLEISFLCLENISREPMGPITVRGLERDAGQRGGLTLLHGDAWAAENRASGREAAYEARGGLKGDEWILVPLSLSFGPFRHPPGPEERQEQHAGSPGSPDGDGPVPEVVCIEGPEAGQRAQAAARDRYFFGSAFEPDDVVVEFEGAKYHLEPAEPPRYYFFYTYWWHGGASCPHVETWDRGRDRWVGSGRILARCRGQSRCSWDSHRLPVASNVVRLVEIEQERTHLLDVKLRVYRRTRGALDLCARGFSGPVTMKEGDVLELRFPDLPQDTSHCELLCRGYYEVVQTLPRVARGGRRRTRVPGAALPSHGP